AGGLASLSCHVEPGADPTPELGARLQGAAIAVQELKLELPTLEEYFYAITDGLDHQAEQDGEAVAVGGDADAAPVTGESVASEKAVEGNDDVHGGQQ
ncbi:MAG: hypothetical protein ACI91B_002251, partial [Planctomycetota bacterium]